MTGRLPLASSLAVAIVLAATQSHAAKPDRKECLAAADDGQKLRDDGKLTVARDKFITCSAKACPAVVSKQCSEWLDEVEKDVPTVSFRVLDEQKRELIDVRLIVDGQKLSDAIEAKTRSIDPGEHTVRIERADGKFVEQKILLRSGEKNRIVELRFEAAAAPTPVAPVAPVAPAPAPEPAPSGGGFHVPLLGWVGLGVGVVGGVGTVLFATSAKSATQDLRDQCAPTCDPSKRDPIDQRLLFANISLGVGVVGLGVGVVATVLANTGKPAKTETAHASVAVDVGPGSVGLHGAF
jgi:hypothetical protein